MIPEPLLCVLVGFQSQYSLILSSEVLGASRMPENGK